MSIKLNHKNGQQKTEYQHSPRTTSHSDDLKSKKKNISKKTDNRIELVIFGLFAISD